MAASRSRRPARAGFLLTLAGLVLTAAACTSHQSSTTTSSTSTTTTSAPTSTSTSSSSTSSTTTAAAAPQCMASELVTTEIGSQGAAGTIEVSFQFKNTSAAACSVDGYPGIQMYSSSSAALATTVVPGGSHSFTNFPKSPVTLAVGGVAFFNMGYSDVQTGSTACENATLVWIIPPGAVDHAAVNIDIQACDNGQLTVSPVFGPGSSYTQTTAPA